MEDFTREMDSWPVDVIGLNCSVGPRAMLETLERMVEFSPKPLSAMPNAGLPTIVEGRNIYLCSPDYIAQYARRFIQAGVRIMGGCCGTTPEHIKQICGEVRSMQPVRERTVAVLDSAKPDVKRLDKVPVALLELEAAREQDQWPRGVDPQFR